MEYKLPSTLGFTLGLAVFWW